MGTGWGGILGATGAKVVTSECSAMVKGRSLAAQTVALKMAMPARVTPRLGLIVANAESSHHRLIQQACVQPLWLSERQRLTQGFFVIMSTVGSESHENQ